MRELSVDMFSTIDGFGGGGPGLFAWMHAQLAEDHVMLLGATS